MQQVERSAIFIIINSFFGRKTLLVHHVHQNRLWHCGLQAKCKLCTSNVPRKAALLKGPNRESVLNKYHTQEKRKKERQGRRVMTKSGKTGRKSAVFLVTTWRKIEKTNRACLSALPISAGSNQPYYFVNLTVNICI